LILSNLVFDLCVSLWTKPRSGIVLHGRNVFLNRQNVGTDTKIVHPSGLDSKILLPLSLWVMAIFKIQDGRHAVLCESGFYPKWKA